MSLPSHVGHRDDDRIYAARADVGSKFLKGEHAGHHAILCRENRVAAIRNSGDGGTEKNSDDVPPGIIRDRAGERSLAGRDGSWLISCLARGPDHRSHRAAPPVRGGHASRQGDQSAAFWIP